MGLRDELLRGSSEARQVQIHSRILGNVIYLMAGMLTTRRHLEDVEKAFIEKLYVSSGR